MTSKIGVYQVSNVLEPLALPTAPPVVRMAGATVARSRLPAWLLLLLGVLLTLGPIVGGLFFKVAAGKQMIDRFKPYIAPDALDRYDADLATIRRAAAGVDEVYIEQHVSAGRYPGIDVLRDRSALIDAHATSLLDRVRRAEPDYTKVADIGGFDRIPFLVVISGIVSIYGGCVLLMGARRRALPTCLLVVAASACVVGYPFVSDFGRGASAGHRMLHTLAPVMSSNQVRTLQDDFIVLVTAVGEMDTSFAAVAHRAAAARDIRALDTAWPAISSDLASLVGAVNDNISNFNALKSLDSITGSGLETFPWVMVGIGATGAALAVASLPRKRVAR